VWPRRRRPLRRSAASGRARRSDELGGGPPGPHALSCADSSSRHGNAAPHLISRFAAAAAAAGGRIQCRWRVRRDAGRKAVAVTSGGGGSGSTANAYDLTVKRSGPAVRQRCASEQRCQPVPASASTAGDFGSAALLRDLVKSARGPRSTRTQNVARQGLYSVPYVSSDRAGTLSESPLAPSTPVRVNAHAVFTSRVLWDPVLTGT
jgi:hypothetical protein